ncbi:MAG: DUF2283 domain-containing protein [Chloroflexi bacterium]|nr:DUF2283 domain-containing protein [Chloroflexota bacterium]
MRINYFPDTDTLLITFNERKITDTHDLNEDILVELDESGQLVSMTIEHAKRQTDVSEFSYQQVA